MKLKAIIKFKILENHPDKDLVVGGWNRDKVYNFSDTYSFPAFQYATREQMDAYIKRDLTLVAAGGYRTDTIEIVDFITEVV